MDTFRFDVALPMTNYSQKGFKNKRFSYMLFGKKPLKYSTKTPAPSLLITPPLQNSLMKVPPAFILNSSGGRRAPRAVPCRLFSVGPVSPGRRSLSLRKSEYL